VDTTIAPLLYSLQQAREDLAKWTEGLTDEQLWARPNGTGAVGFQIRHIAGSLDRLATYLRGEQLSDAQMAEMKSEMEPGQSREELLTKLETVCARVEEQVRSIDVATLREPRQVGRKQLPTSVIGLLMHMAEHTQRHVGEAIVTCKFVR
jgi:uncharacterized damage-inducible protein DinB